MGFRIKLLQISDNWLESSFLTLREIQRQRKAKPANLHDQSVNVRIELLLSGDHHVRIEDLQPTGIDLQAAICGHRINARYRRKNSDVQTTSLTPAIDIPRYVIIVSRVTITNGDNSC